MRLSEQNHAHTGRALWSTISSRKAGSISAETQEWHDCKHQAHLEQVGAPSSKQACRHLHRQEGSIRVCSAGAGAELEGLQQQLDVLILQHQQVPAHNEMLEV